MTLVSGLDKGATPRERGHGRGAGPRGVPCWTRWSRGSFGSLCAEVGTSAWVWLETPAGSVQGGRKDQAEGGWQERPASKIGNKLKILRADKNTEETGKKLRNTAVTTVSWQQRECTFQDGKGLGTFTGRRKRRAGTRKGFSGRTPAQWGPQHFPSHGHREPAQAAASSGAAVWGGGRAHGGRPLTRAEPGAGPSEQTDAQVLRQAMVTDGRRIVTKSAKATWNGVHCTGQGAQGGRI